MKKLYLLSLLLLCSMAFQWENTNNTDENRLALVIGNANYTGTQSKLDNPINDANTMKVTLEAHGFEVIMATDLTLTGFKAAADKFENRINELKKSPNNLVTLFYYSGHGMHVGSTSYLLPVNCKAISEVDLPNSDEYGAFPLEKITNRLMAHGNYLNIIMLDACRDNPFVKKMVAARGGDPGALEGFAPPRRNTELPKQSGMFYAYATAKGEIAKDGYGKNSPYVEGFVAALKTPNLSLEDVLKNTGKYVNQTIGSQNPCTESISFYGNFVFHKKEIPKDTDGDGYIDAVDNCIHVYSKTNNGCPEVATKSIPVVEEPVRTSDPFADQMVRISGGTFQMGSNKKEAEKPIHSVTVSSFYMSKYEVTQKQWRDIMGNDPSYFKNCDNCPVEHLSCNYIQEFIKKLNTKTGKNYRLPTETEWEYAAQGGQSYKYAGNDNIKNVAWYDGNSGSKTHPVGQKSANGYGLYDMSGNVFEWCQDAWHSNYNGAPTNGSAWVSNGNYRPSAIDYVLRGGSWKSDSMFCRTASRTYNYSRGYTFADHGFRLAL